MVFSRSSTAGGGVAVVGVASLEGSQRGEGSVLASPGPTPDISTPPTLSRADPSSSGARLDTAPFLSALASCPPSFSWSGHISPSSLPPSLPVTVPSSTLGACSCSTSPTLAWSEGGASLTVRPLPPLGLFAAGRLVVGGGAGLGVESRPVSVGTPLEGSSSSAGGSSVGGIFCVVTAAGEPSVGVVATTRVHDDSALFCEEGERSSPIGDSSAAS